jgi:hypothetical protein
MDAETNEQYFFMGAFALRQEIEAFIHEKLQGERISNFDRGQDDGLRWVLDHLEYIFGF